ncbi:MAG: hypothetical protein IJX23_05825 [Clostridia bacterium]|nr:hypothetical protein [Clostridia bacterium]
MRKTILKLTTIVMLFVLAFSLVACSVIPQDYKEARSNLRDNDYTVNVGDKDDIVDSDHEYSSVLEMITQLLEYDVIEENEESLEELHPELAEIEKDLDKVLAAFDEDQENLLVIIYFEDASSAKEYFELIGDVFQIAKAEGLSSEIDIRKDDLTYGVSGIVVYFGTQDALDAAK